MKKNLFLRTFDRVEVYNWDSSCKYIDNIKNKKRKTMRNAFLTDLSYKELSDWVKNHKSAILFMDILMAKKKASYDPAPDKWFEAHIADVNFKDELLNIACSNNKKKYYDILNKLVDSGYLYKFGRGVYAFSYVHFDIMNKEQIAQLKLDHSNIQARIQAEMYKKIKGID